MRENITNTRDFGFYEKKNLTDSTLLLSPGFPPNWLHFLIMVSGLKFSYFELKFYKHYFVYSTSTLFKLKISKTKFQILF